MSILDALLTGAIAGGVYGLLALGFALQYGIARILNLAYGEGVVLAGITTALLYQGLSLSPLIALFVLPSLFALGNFLLHRLLFLPLVGRTLALDGEKEGRLILLTFGLSFLIQGFLAAELGGQLFSYSYLGQGVSLGATTVALNRLLAFGVALALVALAHLVFTCTRLGIAVRALSREPEESLLVGIPATRLSTWAFALGGGVGAAAGVLLSTFHALTPASGPEFTLKALVVVILGD
ncbi:ABC transporter permease subunit [Thermus caldilimi]|uniref:ABC transporter permease subunit n=1 Tax=Thermus caldilimi TaxID=2483360 RepID=UPI001F110EC6|nr:branched-chain amino acid ABC transporter permease [Thermus caldilimi]